MKLIRYAGLERRGYGVGSDTAAIVAEAARNMRLSGLEAIGASHITMAQRRELLASIPDDDRDLTGRLQGDPVSVRSALGRRSC